MQRQQAQAKKQVQKIVNPEMMTELGEDFMDKANDAGREFADDVKRGLKKTAKTVSKGLKKASDSLDKIAD